MNLPSLKKLTPTWGPAARHRTLRLIQGFPAALPEDERGFWCGVRIAPSNNFLRAPMSSSDVRELRSELMGRLNTPPLRTAPFVGVLTLRPGRHPSLEEQGTRIGWTYVWHGVARVPFHDRRAKVEFRTFAGLGDNLDVVRLHPLAEADGRMLRLSRPSDLIAPIPEQLHRSRLPDRERLCEELGLLLGGLLPSDLILQRGLRGFFDLISEPVAERTSICTLVSTTRRLRTTPPFVRGGWQNLFSPGPEVSELLDAYSSFLDKPTTH